MSFLRWFGKKDASRESVPEQSSDLGQVDVTLPINRLMHLQLPPDKPTDVGSRRNERLERRELLYGVVRECMTAAGVLSSTYKFKVLSLDSSGRKYLIMVDMPREQLTGAAHFADTEGAIARSAKDRYDILVTAVYWRVNELVSAAGLAPHTAVDVPVQTAEHHRSTPVAPPAQAANPYADLQAEEVMAFKRAVAAAANGAGPRSETRKLARHKPENVPDFSDTEPFEAAAPLGPSQFGGLSRDD
jgi:hypothetical protein